MIALYILVVLGLGSIDGWPLLREKRWKEAAAYSILLIMGLGIIIINTASSHPFRVTAIINYVFQPYYSAIKSFFL